MDAPLGWGTHEVPEQGSLKVAIGPLGLRFRRIEGELRALTGRRDDERESAEASWTRWAAGDVGQISVTPRFPDRSLVVQPDDPFWLLSGSEARIYVRVPAHAMVHGLGSKRHDLMRVPTVILSDTWWGTVEEGELCYWLATSARRVVRPADIASHLVICPLQLVNNAAESLPVERIALRVAHLGIYSSGDALWSDETRVRYTGDVEGSRIEMEGRPPREAPDAELLAPPERTASGGFSARTFRRIRSITGLGG